MKWIVITQPNFIENEATYINKLFDASLKAFWNLVVSSVKMDTMKMKFLAKF